jgi:hypothetical protein
LPSIQSYQPPLGLGSTVTPTTLGQPSTMTALAASISAIDGKKAPSVLGNCSAISAGMVPAAVIASNLIGWQ